MCTIVTFPYLASHIARVAICLLLVLSSPAWSAEITVTLEGVDKPWQEAVQSNLSLYQQRNNTLLNELLIQSLHRKAPGEIKRTLQSFGFYQAKVSSELTRQDADWRAHYRVEPGPRVQIHAIDVVLSGPGSGDDAFQQWQAALSLKVGDPLDHALYEKVKQQLMALAEDRGYFDATLLRHEIQVTIAQQQADIILHFDSGPRYRFGEITLNQSESILHEGFLARYLTFSAGDSYLADKLFELHRAMLESGYYQRVEIRPQREQTQDQAIPVEVLLHPRPRMLYTFGVGYGTDTLARINVGFENRYVNRRGHRLTGGAQVSGIGRQASLSYRIPLLRAPTDFLDISPGVEQEYTDTVKRTTQTVNASLTSQVQRWMQTLFISFQQERFVIADEHDKSILLVPGASWQRTEADNRLQPRNGWSLFLQVRGGAESLGSDASFLQWRGAVKGVKGIGSRGRLIGRVDGGLTRVAQFSELPASYRFFAGGDYSVRGYAFQSLGPTDASGRVVGGENLLTASIEYNHLLKGAFDWALFYDMGNAFDGSDFSAKEGAGVGVRWRLPVGALRFDVAKPLSDPDRPWRFHLTIGLEL